MENSELDISAFLLFPADGWFWKVRGEMLDGRTQNVIMCTIIESQVNYIRN